MLLALANVGFVLFVSWWLDRHARFDTPANSMGTRVAVGWLVSGGVVFIGASAAARQRYHVMATAARMGSLLIPFFVLATLGALCLVVVGRAERRGAAGNA
jgi:hypothetical protein